MQDFQSLEARSFAAANPAGGAEFSHTVPAGEVWHLLAVTVANVQAAAGASQPILVIDDGTNVLFESFGSSAAQAISTTCQYTWAAGLPLTGQIGATTNVHSTGPLPAGLILLPTWRIRSVTIGLSANTDYGVPRLYAVELS